LERLVVYREGTPWRSSAFPLFHYCKKGIICFRPPRLPAHRQDCEQAGELTDPEDLWELEHEATRMAEEIEAIFGHQEAVPPYNALPTFDLAAARAVLDNRAAAFYRNALAWHRAAPDTREPSTMLSNRPSSVTTASPARRSHRGRSSTTPAIRRR
jgi:hypothetical protein